MIDDLMIGLVVRDYEPMVPCVLIGNDADVDGSSFRGVLYSTVWVTVEPGTTEDRNLDIGSNPIPRLSSRWDMYLEFWGKK